MSYETGLSMEERVTSLFQPDTLLPEQYLDTVRRKLHLEPEKKLMLAVLEDAIACFQKYVFAREGKGRILFQEAEDWVQDTNGDRLFFVCQRLRNPWIFPRLFAAGSWPVESREVEEPGKGQDLFSLSLCADHSRDRARRRRGDAAGVQ